MIEQGTRPGEPPEAVLDTNTVLDMLLFDDGAARALRDAVAGGRVRWIATTRMRDELQGVLRRPAIGRWHPAGQAVSLLAWVDSRMVLRPTPPPGLAPRCRDAAYQPFIDLAWTAGAHWLVSRDKALLRLSRVARQRGVRVCTPAHWPGDAGSESD
jgi:predicted nucleic acid-binding protein